MRPARVAWQPARQLAAAQTVRVQPPAPTRRAARRPAPAPAATPGRGSARNLALIGVFGASGNRHALVQLPSGAVERVRPGDRVQGVQVAAVGTDSVRLLGGGRETVLTLPE